MYLCSGRKSTDRNTLMKCVLHAVSIFLNQINYIEYYMFQDMNYTSQPRVHKISQNAQSCTAKVCNFEAGGPEDLLTAEDRKW